MPSTNVPSPSFGSNGFVVPSEAAVLAGVQADQQAAFGGDLNPSLTTPQGQLATSLTAIIGDANDQMVALFNGVDPAYAAGRMQDAIGRIYYIERNPAQPSVVTATCSGLTGTTVPVGAQALDQSGNIWLSTQSGVIPIGGTVDLTFACSVTGPLACPTGWVNAIYQAIPGWDSVTNAGAGVEGSEVESRSAFEFRRAASVAINAQGSLPSVLGAVLAVSGVLDAYATENVTGSTSGALATGSIAGATLTVTAIGGGAIAVGQMVVGSGVTQGTIITALGSGTGGTGTYTVSISQTAASTSLVCAVGGVRLAPHSLYVAAYGGAAQSVGEAIWRKKSPGCDYNGNTTVSVVDSAGYAPPYPSYAVTFQIPAATPVLFSVMMQNNAAVPSNAVALIQAAILASFSGADGGPRARIGSWLFASRFYANVAALGSWALVYAIQLGVGAANQSAILLRIDQVPTASASDIAVSFV